SENVIIRSAPNSSRVFGNGPRNCSGCRAKKSPFVYRGLALRFLSDTRFHFYLKRSTRKLIVDPPMPTKLNAAVKWGKRSYMRHMFTLACCTVVLVSSRLGDISAAARSKHQYSARNDLYARHYAYPRPNCTYAIAEYQRRWPQQLWPPSMRC